MPRLRIGCRCNSKHGASSRLRVWIPLAPKLREMPFLKSTRYCTRIMNTMHLADAGPHDGLVVKDAGLDGDILPIDYEKYSIRPLELLLKDALKIPCLRR